MKKYDPQHIEAKWQGLWEEAGIYRAADFDPRPKYYYLVEFPYPSGDGLHVGHVRSYTALDIMARHKRMLGFNVLYPMGFDEFGLPTENFAIKNKIAPQVATERNVANFRRQMKALGLSFDWSREVRTSNPKYYKWTQWIFLQMYKAGLAYQAELPINWCPFEKTGLANEEVVDGRHERCGTLVEKKLLKQWVLAITKYADRLVEDLGSVDYLDKIATQQVNWVGRSEGAEIEFELKGVDSQVKVYTTRPDTLFGVTFLVASPEVAKSWEDQGWQPPKAAKGYIDTALRESELQRQEDTKEKTGVDTGVKAVHPITGELLPVWVADYVLGSYGTGAIMAVPAHDQRDGEFAKKFGLPIQNVIDPLVVRDDAKDMTDFHKKRKIVALVENSKGEILTINWGPKLGGRLTVGGTIEGDEAPEVTALREVEEETGYHDLEVVEVGQETMHYKYYAFSKKEAHDAEVNFVHLRLAGDGQKNQRLDESEKDNFKVEWVSREVAEREITEPLHRYGFEKFIRGQVFAGDGVLVNSGEFDGLEGVEARRAIVKWLFDHGKGQGATKYKLRDWIFSRQHYWGEPIPIIHCEKDGAVPVPDDQLPVELPKVESYEPTDTGESPLAAMTEWVNVKCPNCGGPARRETDTMPNWAGSSWYYLRYADPHNDQAFADPKKLEYWTPVDLYNGGMEHTTLHLLYSRFWHKFLYDQGLVPSPEPYARRRSHGMILAHDNQKMSKSRGNVVNPDSVVEKYGADTLRVYEMFMGPFDEATSWSDERLGGANRFLYRVWNLSMSLMEKRPAQYLPSKKTDIQTGVFQTEVDRMTHKTLKKVGEDIEGMNFNTMVSSLMEYLNFLSSPERLANFAKPENDDFRSKTLRILILMVAPLTPHLAEELWHELGETESVHIQPWPKYDPELIKDDVVTVIVQVNGKVRGEVVLPVDAVEAEVVAAAQADPNVARHLDGKQIAKTITVPRKLVNFVVK